MNLLNDPVIMVPLLVFVAVFGLVLALSLRGGGRDERLAQHRLTPAGTGAAVAHQSDAPRRPKRASNSPLAKLKARFANAASNESAQALLTQAGSDMSVGRFQAMRLIATLVFGPILAVLVFLSFGPTVTGFGAAAAILLAVPRLPTILMKRKAKTRAHQMDMAMPDVIDLLVVSVEGGQSLQTAILQVANRMDNIAAVEFRRLLEDLNGGMARRDAFLALAGRNQSESLETTCTTIIQADKVGMSVSRTLRTLSETMRAQRRQAAETKARQAPIKMMPVLVGFMLPAMLAVIVGPVILQLVDAFQ